MRNTSTVLIVGGDVRHFQLDKLRAALGGLSVEWIPTRESDPGSSRFEARLRRQDTSLVVILCGLVRHRHGRRLLRLHRSANIHAISSTLLGTPPLHTASDKQFIQQGVEL